MLEDENSQENTTMTRGLSIEATQSRQVLNKFQVKFIRAAKCPQYLSTGCVVKLLSNRSCLAECAIVQVVGFFISFFIFFHQFY